MRDHHEPKKPGLNYPTELRKARYIPEQRIVKDGTGFEVGAAAEADVGERAGNEDCGHPAARGLVFLHRDVASP